ncbi:hypothetical protein GGR54DRAFT_619479 [Hypoxylon sp. NC1633]|nr:hypothetical protein GGR54DRAFT_619479 [Hypoxylon sp. NC1633]
MPWSVSQFIETDGHLSRKRRHVLCISWVVGIKVRLPPLFVFLFFFLSSISPIHVKNYHYLPLEIFAFMTCTAFDRAYIYQVKYTPILRIL